MGRLILIGSADQDREPAGFSVRQIRLRVPGSDKLQSGPAPFANRPAIDPGIKR